ncbi:MAG: hypothetical protein ACPG4U_00370 [Pseudomonadales bacterium]
MVSISLDVTWRRGLIYSVRVALCGFLVAGGLQVSASQVTPSHVFQLSEQLLSDIELIRHAQGIYSQAKEPEVQIDKVPLQVYVKSLEVRTKVIYLQRKFSQQPLAVKEVPLRALHSQDVFNSVTSLLEALQPIKAKLKIENSAQAPYVAGKTPANVYENLWQASYSLDELVGSISPNLVYRNMLYALEDTKMLAASLNVTLNDQVPPVTENVKPIAPNIEGYKNLYRLARIERKLSLPAVGVRPFPSGEISPSDVFDTTNNILAELARLKVARAVTEPHGALALPSGKRPADVLEKMRLLGRYLDSIAQRI